MFSNPFFAWLVHLLTASTAVIGLLTLNAIALHHYILAFYLMGAAIFIDAIDGTLARFVNVKKYAAKIDGTLLDNIVDFINYVITPCFMLLSAPNMLHSAHRWILVGAIALASCYQFSQCDAKTEDHFFKGFPCYWNIVVFYLFIFSTSVLFNEIVLLILCILVFVPIKYVYPSRLDYLTTSAWLKRVMQVASILYGVSCLLIIYQYPKLSTINLAYSAGYIIFYLWFSIIRTLYPLIKEKTRKK